MILDLYFCLWNEAPLLPFFLAHYMRPRHVRILGGKRGDDVSILLGRQSETADPARRQHPIAARQRGTSPGYGRRRRSAAVVAPGGHFHEAAPLLVHSAKHL